MKRLFFIFFLNCFVYYSTAQLTWQWASGATGSGSESGNSVTADAAGNVYVTGYFFSSTLVFGTNTLTNSGNYDCYVAKFDPSGNILWAKSLGGTFDDVGNSIAVDAAGNVYATGYYYSPVLSAAATTVSNAGIGDAFVVKYDASGNLVWLKSIGGNFDENGNGIATDNAGNVFVTGYFQSASIPLGTNTLTNSGNDDLFIVKMDPSGNSLWVANAQGPGNDVGKSICTDISGNVMVTGYFAGSVVFGTSTLSSTGSTDIFTVKYNGSGLVAWAGSAGGNLNDVGYSIASDPSGNVYITGCYLSSTLSVGTNTFLNGGNNDVFVIKYANSGSVTWTKTFGGSLDDTGYGIAADAGGNVYVTGHIHSTALILGTYTISNSGVGDMYLVQYSSGGNVLWAQNTGGGSDEGGSSVAVGPGAALFVTGFFISSSVSFSTNVLNNTGSDDIFVAKLIDPTVNLLNLNASNYNSDIKIYPNPSSGEFYVSGYDKNSIIRIYDLTGELISELRPLEATQFISLRNRPKGIYLVGLNTSSAILSRKIIVQ